MTHAFTDHPFWHFSVNAWKDKSAEEACLHFQNKYAMNTNFILLACWLACKKQSKLTSAAMCELLKISESWHEEVIVALRNARNATKAQQIYPELHDAKMAVKQKIKEVELRAEAVEQAILFQHLALKDSNDEDPFDIAKHNIEIYCQVKHIELDQVDQALMPALIQTILRTSS